MNQLPSLDVRGESAVLGRKLALSSCFGTSQWGSAVAGVGGTATRLNETASNVWC
jgi:hypothetical protein